MCVKDGLMRMHPWLAALSSFSLLLAAGESTAQAQQASNVVYEAGSFDEALQGTVNVTSFEDASLPEIRSQSPGPVYFEPAYTNNDPAVLWPQSTPPSYQPYPQISPYYQPNVAQTTTYNRDGLWFREMLHKDRDYFATLEYLLVRYRNPGNATVGADPARFLKVNPTTPGTGSNTGGGGSGNNSGTGGNIGSGGGGGSGSSNTVLSGGLVGVVINNHGLGGPAQFGIGSGGPFQRISVGPGVFPFPFVFQNVSDTNRQAVLDETLFPIRTLGFFDNFLKGDGIRARWGYFNEDGSGLMLTGWSGTRVGDRFQFGHDAYNGVVVNQDFILANSPPGGSGFVYPRNGSLPLLTRNDFLNSGSDPLTDLSTLGFTGISTKFDVLFQYDIQTYATGGSLNIYQEPIYKRKWVTVRPTIGARYQYLDENFRFRGIDSGLGYNLNFGSTGSGGGGGGGGGGGNTGGGGGSSNQSAPTFRPSASDLSVIVDDVGNPFFFEANLRSQVSSQMAGPEAGFRYDFGESKHFSIWGQSTFALLANREKSQLNGKNIGDPVNYFEVTGDNWADPTDGINTNFSSNETHVHASPMFEQSVFFDMDVFRYVPVLKKLPVLENARFRTGYTYIVIGSVTRPGDQVVWRSYPDLPSINANDRHTWSTHNWSFAVDWTF